MVDGETLRQQQGDTCRTAPDKQAAMQRRIARHCNTGGDAEQRHGRQQQPAAILRDNLPES